MKESSNDCKAMSFWWNIFYKLPFILLGLAIVIYFFMVLNLYVFFNSGVAFYLIDSAQFKGKVCDLGTSRWLHIKYIYYFVNYALVVASYLQSKFVSPGYANSFEQLKLNVNGSLTKSDRSSALTLKAKELELKLERNRNQIDCSHTDDEIQSKIENSEDAPFIASQEGSQIMLNERSIEGDLRFCSKCEILKPDRSHHCSECKKCVLKSDHHCPWVDNCIGFKNLKFFYLLLLYGTFALTFLLLEYIQVLLQIVSTSEVKTIAEILFLIYYSLMLLLFILLSMLWMFQTYLLFTNTTSFEYICMLKPDIYLNQFYAKRFARYNIETTLNLKNGLGEEVFLWFVPYQRSESRNEKLDYFKEGINFESHKMFAPEVVRSY